MSDDQLVDRFEAICIEQDEALLHSEIAKFKRLYPKMRAIENELKQRPGDHRRALLRLLDHPNAQVRLQAAGATLAVEPKKARSVIEALAGSRKYPQAGDAGMTLFALDEGIFKPT